MSKILVVDDESDIRQLCYQIFVSDNHRVITCARGDEALHQIKSEKPDLVLMDIAMPGEHGLSLLQKIRTQDPKTAVVVFSGVITTKIEIEAYQSGAIDVLDKSISTSELRRRVNQILAAKHRVFQMKEHSRGQKVLVVDDDEQIRNLLAGFLKEKGYEVLTAASGEEAIAAAEKGRPSLILLDISLPGIDGVLTLRRIKDILPDAGVVMTTGINDPAIAEETSKLGAYAYVLKPFDMQYLELVVLSRLCLAGGGTSTASPLP